MAVLPAYISKKGHGMDEEQGLSAETKAIVASNLVGTVALLRANRWDEGDAKRFALRVYQDFLTALG
jgi:hypothetical protein